MNVEIPNFLIEMSGQINEQNNRCTADPLFEVRYKTSLITEAGYNESHYEIISEDGYTLYHSDKSDDYTELARHLFEYDLDWCKALVEDELADNGDEEGFVDWFLVNFDDDIKELPSDIRKLHMQTIEVTVNSHFTEAGAQQFINRKQHDYPELYIYAISLCYVTQMTELRNWIKSLTVSNQKDSK